MQQMVTHSQTQVDGRYIFSGDNDGSPSYQYDASAPSGVDQLQASTATRQMEDTTGTTYPVGLSATQIFDARDSSGNPASGNVFAAMNAVRTALLANDTTALQTAATGVQTASTYMNQQATFYGTAQNRITASLATANQQSVSLQQDLSNRQDADSTSAILEMQQYTTDMQAALASEAKLPHTTLFDALQG
jgi:flagellin-like hook-associated protein FlgL